MAAHRTEIIYSAPPGRRPDRAGGKKLPPALPPSLGLRRVKNFFGKILESLGKPLFRLLLTSSYLLLAISSFFLRLRPRLPVYISHTCLAGRRVTYHISQFRLPKIRLPKISFPKVTKNFLIFVLVVFLFSFFIFIFYSQILKDLPNPEKLITRDQIISTKIYDRNSKLLYQIYRSQNRTLVPLSEMPLFLRQGVVAIEDAEFYFHHGYSLKGIFRALRRIISGGKIEGGSTITQQLVKNALLSPERTLRRKIKEIILALWVEQKFSKDEILQMYLNEVGFGGAAYGVEEASKYYFGKNVRDLNLAEATLLAGLPASPTTFSPFGAHPEKAKERQELVLRRMVEEKFITPQRAAETLTEDIHLTLKKTDIAAPHFVMYVKQILVEKYGEKMVEEGGLEVKTSLDLDVQNLTQKMVFSELEKLKPLKISNGAALVTNPQTGEILAMVGSKDYFDLKNQGNFNVTTALRQPGSAIKPVNYAVALSMGFTPATVISDTPITYKVAGQPPYSPKNYDGKFHGNVPLRTALASSYNVPAVKVLSALGVSRMIEQGQKMGITTWNDPSQYGLSLTLGGGEVKMTDLAVVYGTLVNLGTRVDLQSILEVKDYKGKILEKLEIRNSNLEIEDERVLSPAIAYLLTDILSDNVARMLAFGPNSVLVIPGKTVAVKTGTSNNLKDNWTIGYTPSFLVATWVGNNDASPMAYVASGVTGASPIWHNIMSELLKDKPEEKFTKPESLARVEICALTGTLACDACPSKKWEFFLPGSEPKRTCSEEEIKKILEEKEKPTP